ncbi:MAG: hypothetical protein AUG51_19095 [Acidobacteria bacterium 13_1_20CM_3_53_8]|nr:MAG: hypothetical protein AUG51_19095 [Acidobacteria bacterium 13_1_20CM_3_53_8]
MFKWNEYEFIECLGVLPLVGPDEQFHFFRVEKDSLRLELVVFQYEADVRIEIYKQGLDAPIFQTQIMSCPGVIYVSEKNERESLEFAGLFGYSRLDEEPPLVPMVTRVMVNPQIRVELSIL